MNIFVPHKWLKELANNSLPENKIEELLTLRSSSVEYVRPTAGDNVMEIEVTTNRGDNLSILGIARELNAICKAENVKCKFENPLESVKEIQEGTKDLLNIKIDKDNNINPRFTAVVIDNVKVKESPKIIKERLTQAGIRPINNIVDITNYIMILTGQPMHAFDYDKIKDGVMHVTTSKKGDKLKTLDGAEYTLPKGSIIIKDSEKIIDLCGIMGGENTEISHSTSTVVLFTQVYNPQLVRKTSLALNTRTEAVQRFEHLIDPTIQKKALLLALNILEKDNDFTIASIIYDVNNNNYKPHNTLMTYKKLNTYSGMKFQTEKAQSILEGLGFETIENTDKQIKVQVPSHRNADIKIEEDLIEEVVRIYGYEKIGFKLPLNHFDIDIYDNTNKIERLIKNHLKSVGFNELIAYTMVSKDQVNLKKALKIDNPLGKQMEYMRTSIKPTMVQAIKETKKEVNIFELGNIYLKNDNNLPNEIKKLCILTNSKHHEYKMINLVRDIGTLLNFDKLSFKYPRDGIVNVYEKQSKVGKIFVSQNYSYASLSFKKLVENYNDYPNVQEQYNTTTIIEDLTIITPKQFKAGVLLNQLLDSDKNLTKVDFKDDYRKDKKRAVTFTFYYQNPKTNLTDKTVAKSRNRVIKFIEDKLNLKVDRPK